MGRITISHLTNTTHKRKPQVTAGSKTITQHKQLLLQSQSNMCSQSHKDINRAMPGECEGEVNLLLMWANHCNLNGYHILNPKDWHPTHWKWDNKIEIKRM